MNAQTDYQAKITVNIPQDLDAFLTQERSKRNPRTGKKIRNHQIVTAALDLLKQKMEENPKFSYLDELAKRSELPLEK